MNLLGTPISKWLSRWARRRPGRIQVSRAWDGSLPSRALRKPSHEALGMPGLMFTAYPPVWITRVGSPLVPNATRRARRDGGGARLRAGDSARSSLREPSDLALGESLQAAEQGRDPAFRRVISQDQALGPPAVHDEGGPIVEVSRPAPANHD